MDPFRNAIDGFHDEEVDGERGDEKRYKIVQEVAIIEDTVMECETEFRKVGLAEDGGDKWCH